MRAHQQPQIYINCSGHFLSPARTIDFFTALPFSHRGCSPDIRVMLAAAGHEPYGTDIQFPSCKLFFPLDCVHIYYIGAWVWIYIGTDGFTLWDSENNDESKKCWVNEFPDIFVSGIGIQLRTEVKRVDTSCIRLPGEERVENPLCKDLFIRTSGIGLVRENTFRRCYINVSTIIISYRFHIIYGFSVCLHWFVINHVLQVNGWK